MKTHIHLYSKSFCASSIFLNNLLIKFDKSLRLQELAVSSPQLIQVTEVDMSAISIQ